MSCISTCQTDSPIFIIGCQRSGTTLLQVLVDAHPNIAIPPEGLIYPRFSAIFHCYGDLSRERNLRTFVRDLIRDWRVQSWGIPFTVDSVIRSLKGTSRGAVIKGLFKRYADVHGATRWGEKTPTHVTQLRQIIKDFPDARFIHIVRDGRDVAESIKRMGWGPVTIPALAKLWRQHVIAFDDASAFLPAEHVLELRYEDLVCEPARVMTDVFAFLEEPIMDATTAYEETGLWKRYMELHEAHASLAGGVGTDRIGRFKKAFTRREIELFEHQAGDVLETSGYPCLFTRPRPPSRKERVRCWLAECAHRLCLKVVHLHDPKTHGQHLFRGCRRYTEWLIKEGLSLTLRAARFRRNGRMGRCDLAKRRG